MPKRKPAAAKSPSTRPLRLEWIEAGSLAENPANWRRHPQEQVAPLKDLLNDPEIGWAGACLYNERTKRLIDGHARRSVVDPAQPIPVLVGSWSPEAEQKILATLDPIATLAQGDADAYRALAEQVDTDSLWVRDLLHQTAAGLTPGGDQDDDQTGDEADAVLPQMELQPFERYDYLMLLFRNEQDFQSACERLGVRKVQVQYPGGLTKVGLGRCLDGARAIAKLSSTADRARRGAPEGGEA